MARQAARPTTRLAITALIGNAALAAAKYVAAAAGGSAALLAEAVHSTVDTLNEALLLLGLQRAERTGADDHGLGKGRELQFWSVAAAVLLFGVGAGVALSEGIERLANPRPLSHAGWLVLVLLASLAFQVASWAVAWRRLGAAGAGRPLLARLRQAEDPTLFPLVFADTAGVAGVLVALAGVVASAAFGWLSADGLAALAVAAILGAATVLLLRETHDLLVGGAEPDLVEDIMGVAGRAAFVNGVNEVRTLRLGPAEIVVNLSVDARDQVPAGEVERGVAALEAELRDRHPQISRVHVEIRAGAEPEPA